MTVQKTIIFFIVCVMMVSSAGLALGEVPKERRESILQAVFPDLKITMTDIKKGTAEIDGKQSIIVVSDVVEAQVGEQDYTLLFMIFVEMQKKLALRLENGELVTPPKHKNVLIIAHSAPPYAPKKIILDEHAIALYVSPRPPEAGDLIGDGTTQVRFGTQSMYGFFEPHEMVLVDRFWLYQIPEGKLRFVATTTKLFLRGPRAGQNERKRVELVDSGKGGPRSIRLTDRNKGKEKLLPFKDGKYEYVAETPWVRPAGKKITRKAGSKLRLRVVDSAGKPIQGAWIHGGVKKLSFLTWSDSGKSFSAKTNEKGEFSKRAGDGIYLTIEAEGFYPLQRSWTTIGPDATDNDDLVPRELVVITLQREHLRVPMHDNKRRLAKRWRFKDDKLPARYAGGIRLIDGRSRHGRGVYVEKEELADIWIEVTPIPAESKKWKEWKLRITGHNGWELAPGPKGDNTEKIMRAAPEFGYVRELKYAAGGDYPRGFYLRHEKQNRYGKLWGFVFYWRPPSRSGFMAIEYMVQAKDVGCRSLNPEKRK